jgi:hypothetical protein
VTTVCTWWWWWWGVHWLRLATHIVPNDPVDLVVLHQVARAVQHEAQLSAQVALAHHLLARHVVDHPEPHQQRTEELRVAPAAQNKDEFHRESPERTKRWAGSLQLLDPHPQKACPRGVHLSMTQRYLQSDTLMASDLSRRAPARTAREHASSSGPALAGF